MKETLIKIFKYGLIILITAAVSFFITRTYFPGYTVGETVDSTQIKIINIEEIKNQFAADYADLKAQLIDSLKKNPRYKNIVQYIETFDKDSLLKQADDYWKQKLEDTLKGYVYSSTIDTNFVAKDSSGVVTDEFYVLSSFWSPLPLHPACDHSLYIDHKNYWKQEKIDTRVKREKTVVEKSFWDVIDHGIVSAGGYGVTQGKWDYFIGYGIMISPEKIIDYFKK